MQQSTTPSLSQTIWPTWASRQFLSLLIVQTLLPVTLGYSLSSEAVVMRQLRGWKSLWRRSLTCSHKRTSMRPSWPEVVGTVLQMHSSRRRLLRRGLEFHVCTINKGAHTKKSGNVFNDPRIYIYIYIYIYILPSLLGLYNTPSTSLQRGNTPPNKCPRYDTKQSDGEVPLMLELWGM